jgi:hypothetical protein
MLSIVMLSKILLSRMKYHNYTQEKYAEHLSITALSRIRLSNYKVTLSI